MDTMLSVWMTCTDQALWRGQDLRSVAAPRFLPSSELDKPLELGKPCLARSPALADSGCFRPIHCLGSVFVLNGCKSAAQ